MKGRSYALKGEKYEMCNWFVFFVQTGKEEIVCDYLNKMSSNKGSIEFIPRIQLICKNSKQVRKELKPMFPGYVFYKTKVDAESFVSQIMPLARKFKHIINLLGRENINYMSLCEEEKNFLIKFCDNQHVVCESLGFIKGDRILVTSGPLKGIENVIKRINRHKRRAEIEWEFLGDVRRITVSLEIVKKV